MIDYYISTKDKLFIINSNLFAYNDYYNRMFFFFENLIEKVIYCEISIQYLRQNNFARNNSPCIFPQRPFHRKMHASVVRDTPGFHRLPIEHVYSISEGCRCAACSSFLVRDAKNFCNLRMNGNETVIAHVSDTSACSA